MGSKDLTPAMASTLLLPRTKDPWCNAGRTRGTVHWWGLEQRLANSLVDRLQLLEGERERDKRVDETIWWVSASNQGPTAVRIASRAARADEGCSALDDTEACWEAGAWIETTLFFFPFLLTL